MKLLAGTSTGVFLVGSGQARQVLASRGVRTLGKIGDTVYAGTGDGLFASVDSGLTWTSAGLDGFEVWQVNDAGDGAIVVGTQPAGLFKSFDAGQHWQPVLPFNEAPDAQHWGIPLDPPVPARARALVVDQHNCRRICVGVEVGGVMRSLDGGSTWQQILPGDNPDLHMMFQHPAKPDVLFASTGYGRRDGIAEMIEGNAGVFVSNDFGATWTYRWQGVVPRYSRPMCIEARAPWPLTVGSAPTAFSAFRDDGGAGAMLYRSDDEGLSWRSLGDARHSPSSANFHGLVCDPSSPGGVLTGTDSGEVWRVSADADWEMMAGDLPPVLALAALS